MMAPQLITPASLARTLASVRYHCYSIWLFTRSDIKTIILPTIVFAVAHGLALQQGGGYTTLASRPYFIRKTFTALIWIWLNLLPFNIDNQRRLSAIEEDGVNKPWRTLPSNRMTPIQAAVVMRAFYVLAILFSALFGGLTQNLTLIGLGYWYNNLEGADKHFMVRNFINACGFVCFSSGALEVLLGGNSQILYRLLPWFLFIAAVVLTTVQTQDMYDQPGDLLRKRKTMPLVLGDPLARAITAACMMLWSFAVPVAWNVDLPLASPFIAGGLLVGSRLMLFRSVSADKRSFVFWNAWMAGLYMFPLLSGADLRGGMFLLS